MSLLKGSLGSLLGVDGFLGVVSEIDQRMSTGLMGEARVAVVSNESNLTAVCIPLIQTRGIVMRVPSLTYPKFGKRNTNALRETRDLTTGNTGVVIAQDFMGTPARCDAS